MLDATEEVYGRHMDTSGWDKVEPEEWAEKVLAAVEADKSIVGPGGRLAVAKLASRGPAFLRRRDQRPDVQPAAAALADRAAPRRARRCPASGLASTVCTSPIRRSAKPASQ